ncbi:MAG: hypothetical protein IJY30_05875, partial [Muribaculaceae bacterium]|nr:hypothetical protein [Muribaculaceae bacterium]
GTDIYGNRVKCKIVKNKVAPPFRVAEFDILYGKGISRVGEVLDFAIMFDIIKKSGSWFSYGDTRLAQGRDATKRMISDNPELADELEAKIMEAMKDCGNKPAQSPKINITPALAKPVLEDVDDELPDDFSIDEDI